VFLIPRQPKASPPGGFSYDPAKPVPEHGGNGTGTISLAEPRDQLVIESREDVLVYTSEPLSEAIEVTGSVIVELWATTSAVDTDFVARLIDVQKDGTAYNIAEGILRGRNRDNPDVPGQGVPLEPSRLESRTCSGSSSRRQATCSTRAIVSVLT
jgi:uncharacterized protein